MKKHIVKFICLIIIILSAIYYKDISDYLANLISNNQTVSIAKSNEYTKKYDLLYIKNTKDYIPYSYDDLLNILYSTINNGWEEFTFYCPKEYEDCIKDASILSKDELNLTHLNNFVHPYNSFDVIKTSISDSGEITLKIKYLYSIDDINKINEKINELIGKLYKKSDDDYANIKRIHDYIINNTKYDVERNDKKDSKYNSFSAYGPLFEGYATCNGYADLMAIFLSKLGYENYKIATTKEEISYESNGHVWNAVKIKDKWLHLDLTWDDPVSTDGRDYLYHKYFLVNNEELKKADSGSVNVEEHNFNKSIYLEFNE